MCSLESRCEPAEILQSLVDQLSSPHVTLKEAALLRERLFELVGRRDPEGATPRPMLPGTEVETGRRA